jgi:hypothetical protein
MNDIVIRIKEDGSVSVEEHKDGIKSYKAITPNSLLGCINKSILRGTVSSGLLPKACISFTAHDNGSKDVYILHPESTADITYYNTLYSTFPLPKLLFGFRITGEGKISRCRLGVVGNEGYLKPTTPMYFYPFSNVSDSRLCVGNNPLPKCQDIHTLASLPYHLLSLPNNDDSFNPENNKMGMEMRDLLEHLKDKPPEYYYSDILFQSNYTLSDFIAGGVKN